jgi:hypothetical protein
MKLSLVLTCDKCGAVDRPKPYLRGTRLGGLRIQASTDFYVDGGTVRCCDHTTEEQRARLFREPTWSELDLDAACQTLGITYRIERHYEDRYVVESV